MHRRLKAHIGKVVGRVHSVYILTADDEVLEHSVARKAVSRCRISYLVYVVELDPNAVDELLRRFGCDKPPVDVLLVVGVHILVEAPGGDRVSARLHLQKELNEPEGLASLVEALSTELGHPCAVFSYSEKLRAPCGRALRVRFFQSEVGVPFRVIYYRLAAFYHRLKKSRALYIFGVGEVKGVKQAGTSELINNLLLYKGR